MAAAHVEELFSAATDGQLSEAETQRFNEHLAACAACAASFRSFTAAVESVRALPKAAMPLPVHLPSGAPATERNTAAAWLQQLRRRPVPMRAGTAVAAIAAAAIVAVALTHGPSPATGPAALAPKPSAAGGARSSLASCPAAASAAAVPAFANRASASDISRPGQELVLAASSDTAVAGSQLQLFAVLTVTPAAAAPVGAPVAAGPAGAPLAVAPCLSATGVPAAAITASGPPPAAGDNAVSQAAPASGAAPAARTLTIPRGTPPGTVVRVVATVPADYPGTHQAPLSVAVTITVR